MKNKLRTITIGNQPYVYRLSMHIMNGTCTSQLKVFAEDSKLHPLIIYIRTWDDPIAGCPLQTGFLLYNMATGTESLYNLNHPQRVREWIEYGVINGWDGTQQIEILDGVAAMREMGYEMDKLLPLT
ncbi:hypothetical protein [Paenibacillus sp. GCM10027626]|uniref:hypothetical protein n=1 Tax=Paenibacillus sp. GCM10027626 TaxID=3273411 RepID=UPI0036421EC3